MSKRNRREHGRIISVETLYRGDALADDFLAGVTSITVNDAGDFDEDGGWLYIGAQTVEYTACDDDTGVIDLADPLAAAAEQGDPVHVWSDLYGEVVDYQLALVELDGEYDNPDPVVAEVAEGVGELPEGDRGRAGESCTLKRVSDDEWEVVGVGGRPRSASVSSTGQRFEADDFYALTATDVTAGSATVPLSHRPADEGLVLWWRTTPQEPTEYTINYVAQTITYPLSGFEAVGDRLWCHYAYRKGISTAVIDLTHEVWLSANDASPTLQFSVAQVGSGAVLADDNPGTYMNFNSGTERGIVSADFEDIADWSTLPKANVECWVAVQQPVVAGKFLEFNINVGGFGNIAGGLSTTSGGAALPVDRVEGAWSLYKFTLFAGFETSLNGAQVNVSAYNGLQLSEVAVVVAWEEA